MIDRVLSNVLTGVIIVIWMLCGVVSQAQSEPQGYTSEVPAKLIKYHKALEHLLLNGEVDSATVVYQQLAVDVDTIDDLHAQAWSWYHYGDVLSYSQKYEQSNIAYQKAIALTNSMLTPNIVILIRANNNLNYNLEELGEYDKGFDFILKAYEYLDYAPADEKISNIIFNLARSLKKQGEIGLAGQYMERVIELDKLENDSLAIGHDHQFLAEIYQLQKNVPAVIEEYKKAININPPHQKGRMAMYHNGIANAYALTEELDSAFEYAESAVAYGRASGMNNILAYALSQKGEICVLRKDPLCANIAFNESILLAEDLGMKDLVASTKLKQAPLLPKEQKKASLLKVLDSCDQYDWKDLKRKTLNVLLADETLLKSSERVRLLLDYNEMLKDFIAENAGQEAKRLDARMTLIEREQQLSILRQEALIAEKEAKADKVVRGILIGLVLLTTAGLILLFYTFRQKRELSEAHYRNQISNKVGEIDKLRDRLDAVLEHEIQSIPLPPLDELNAIIDSPLTDKEYDVLVDVAKGLSNREIAEAQFISANTVKFHLKNIFFKLEVGNRKEAIKLIMSSGRG